MDVSPGGGGGGGLRETKWICESSLSRSQLEMVSRYVMSLSPTALLKPGSHKS